MLVEAPRSRVKNESGHTPSGCQTLCVGQWAMDTSFEAPSGYLTWRAYVDRLLLQRYRISAQDVGESTLRSLYRDRELAAGAVLLIGDRFCLDDGRY